MTSRTTSATLERALGRVEGKLDGLTETLDQRFKNIEQQLGNYNELSKTVEKHTHDIAFTKRIGGWVVGIFGMVLSSEFLMKFLFSFAPR